MKMHHATPLDLAVQSGRNVFLTGMAGTGKSTLLRGLIEDLGDEVTVTASTGIAALNIGGMTVHRWSGMMLGPKRGEDPHAYLRLLLRDQRFGVRAGFNRVRECRRLVIDEVSMLSGETLNFLDLMCRCLRRDERPFGGIQVIATGDHLQLPPVRLNPHEPHDWAFLSPAWQSAQFRPIHLTKVHRQDEPEFLKALSEFRVGRLSRESASLLRTRVVSFPDGNLTRLFTHNAQVDRWNTYRLGCLEGEERVYEAQLDGPPAQSDFLVKNLLTPRTLVLKRGARVMFTVNRPDEGYVNGQTGIVTHCGAGVITVECDGDEIYVEPFTWRFDPRDKLSATFTQMPLRLAWSVTIHKCVSLNARVPSRRGLLAAAEVRVGDEVHTGTDGYARCLAVIPQGRREVVCVHTRSGYSLTCTPDHPLLAVRKGGERPAFVEAGSLGSQDHVCLATEPLGLQQEPLPIELPCGSREKALQVMSCDEPLAYLLGALTANGSYHTGDTIFFSNLDNAALRTVRDTLTSIGIRVAEKKTASKARQLYFASAPFFRLMAQLGMAREIACLKSVPEAVWISNDRVRGAFLRGLFDGDGSASGRAAVRLVTTSPRLAREVQLLLLGLGIVSYVHRDFKKQELHHSFSLTVHISGNQLGAFKQQVGFTVKSKARALNAILSRQAGKTSIDFIPHGGHIKNAVQAVFASRPSRGRKGCGVLAGRDRRISAILNTYKNLSRRHMGVLRDALIAQGFEVPAVLAEELNRPVFYDRVTWVEPVGTEEVLDFEIETAHRFQADGFVCHNCQGSTLDAAFIDVRAAREPGQAYVALSRVRTLAGLHLKEWFSGFFVSRAALEFYEGLSPS